MTRNVKIGIASGVATAVALALIFGTNTGKRTYEGLKNRVFGDNDTGREFQDAADEEDIEYPNPTSRTVAE